MTAAGRTAREAAARPPRHRWGVALLCVVVAVVGAAGRSPASVDDEAARLLLRGSYAPAYALLSTRAAPGADAARRGYLLAFSAFHALKLGEARTAARSALAFGYDGPGEGWLPASEIARQSDAGLALFPHAGALSGSSGVAYEWYTAAQADYAQRVLEAAPDAHRAATDTAFGGGAGDAAVPPVSLFVLASNRDAAAFLRALGLPGRTTGSALSIGLAVVMWAELDGQPNGAGPYATRATLAHETLHCIQALLDAEHAPRWAVEGTALLAEDRVDPNHALQLRCRALEDVAADPGLLRSALDDDGPDSDYGHYPAYYALASFAAEMRGLRALGELMRDSESWSASGRESALRRHLDLSPNELADAAYLHMRSTSWSPARALVRVNQETAGGDSSRRAGALNAAHQRWPAEPYIGLLAARELARAGRAEEATSVVLDLAAEGYLGAAECTVADLAAQCKRNRGSLP